MAEVKELEKLPEGWKRRRLGDKDYFVIVGSGIDLFKGMKNYLSTDSVQGTKITHIEDEVSYYNRPSRANMQPKKDRLAFAKMRNTIKVLYIDEKLKSNYILSTGFSLLETKGIYPKYVYQYLLSDLFNSQKDRFAEGTTQEAISNDDFEHIFISFPTSLPEQRKIAEILETVDNAIEKTDRIIEKYKRIKQGLMQDLLTKGIDENGQIRSEETHRFKDSPLGRIPEEWEVVRLGEAVICNPQNGIYKEAKYYDKGDSHIIELNDLYSFNYKIEATKLRKIELFNKELSKYKVSKNDILINRVSKEEEGVAKALLVSKIPPNTVFESNMLRIKLDGNKILPQYFVYYADSQNYKIEKKKYALFSNQTSINQVGVKLIKVIRPPLPEQHRIASILSQIDETIEKEQRYREKLERIKQGLMEDLLTGKVRVNHLIKEGVENVSQT